MTAQVGASAEELRRWRHDNNDNNDDNDDNNNHIVIVVIIIIIIIIIVIIIIIIIIPGAAPVASGAGAAPGLLRALPGPAGWPRDRALPPGAPLLRAVHVPPRRVLPGDGAQRGPPVRRRRVQARRRGQRGRVRGARGPLLVRDGRHGAGGIIIIIIITGIISSSSSSSSSSRVGIIVIIFIIIIITQVDSFRAGVDDVFPFECLASFSSPELREMKTRTK